MFGKRFGIGTRLSVLVCALVILSTGAVGIATYHQISSVLVKRELKELSLEARVAGMRLNDHIGTLRNDVLSLAGTPPIQGVIRAREHDGIDPVDGSSADLWQSRLAVIFTQVMQVKPHYSQIRYIGQD